MRLWLAEYEPAVLLVPLVSWVAPANRGENGFLTPSLKRLWERWSWCPRFLVGDLGYIGAPHKAYCRKRWDTAVLTHRRGDQALVAPFESEREACCPHGQPLRWLGYDVASQEQWFGPSDNPGLCALCWERSTCAQEFAYPAAAQETLLGRLPLTTRGAQTLLKRVRPWIEAAQSYEKNQLGLSAMFLNSLRLTWCWALLADAVSILRARALLQQKTPSKCLLAELAPRQMLLGLP